MHSKRNRLRGGVRKRDWIGVQFHGRGTYGFVEFSVQLDLFFPEFGHVDGGAELPTKPLGGGSPEVFHAKVGKAARLHAVSKGLEKGQLRERLLVQLGILEVLNSLLGRVGPDVAATVLQHLVSRKIILCQTTTNLQLSIAVAQE